MARYKLIDWLIDWKEHDRSNECSRRLMTSTIARVLVWSVLTALPPATSPNSVFLLPLLQVISISGQPRRAYCKIPQSKPSSAGGDSLLRHRHRGTVFLLLYDINTIKQQLKAYLFHIWCVDKQNEYSPPPTTAVALPWFWHRLCFFFFH